MRLAHNPSIDRACAKSSAGGQRGVRLMTPQVGWPSELDLCNFCSR